MRFRKSLSAVLGLGENSPNPDFAAFRVFGIGGFFEVVDGFFHLSVVKHLHAEPREHFTRNGFRGGLFVDFLQSDVECSFVAKIEGA